MTGGPGETPLSLSRSSCMFFFLNSPFLPRAGYCTNVVGDYVLKRLGLLTFRRNSYRSYYVGRCIDKLDLTLVSASMTDHAKICAVQNATGG